MFSSQIAKRTGALAIVSLIAACADSPAPEQPAATTQSAQPAQQATPAGDDVQIQMAQCATPAQGNVEIGVGDTVLRVPAGVIEDAIPTGMQAPLKKEAVRAEVQSRVAAGAGCPGQPLQTALLLVKPQPPHPLLEGTIALLRSNPGSITRQFAELTSGLRDKPSQNCRDLAGDLLACIGTEKRGERETAVMYVISKDRGLVLNTGGPLAARCILQEQQVAGCNLVDQVAGNVTMDITLNAGAYTSDSLAEARRAALATVENWRL